MEDLAQLGLAQLLQEQQAVTVALQSHDVNRWRVLGRLLVDGEGRRAINRQSCLWQRRSAHRAGRDREMPPAACDFVFRVGIFRSTLS